MITTDKAQRPKYPSSQTQLALLTTWFEQDDMRMQALAACAEVFKRLNIADWAIAAGFVRNFFWDKLHGFTTSALNDIDVIYFCACDLSEDTERLIQQTLNEIVALNWSVKNQARMHTRNGDAPYLCCLDAMTYWPEKQTAVAVKLVDNSVIEQQNCVQTFNAHSLPPSCKLMFIFAFDIEDLFNWTISHNPKRLFAVFEQRVAQKKWLIRYPQLVIR
ncbi:nucleotidyltransferase family protein [Shewanella subflava]|uniref:Nucleotidyltransferase family protein n=1 Tax=Shewanella subflava TaxID=2986476 RepID=A0ABT3IDD5_9GAMM|nr:nucleotidyltransferase family protein [Shewanella subflava]MCW3174075.1 nucleotidyltransferase family protein [Shewanella subflava]